MVMIGGPHVCFILVGMIRGGADPGFTLLLV
jgi:hypothetical protein